MRFREAQVFVTSSRDVFSSPNATYLPPFPLQADTFACEVHHPREASKLRWYAPLCPHLPYIARHPSFDSPILERLTCTYRGLPITQHGAWHFLDIDVQTKWHRLETALLWVANVLLTAGRVDLPLGWQPGPVPSSCGYRNRHMEENFARRCAMKSRDAFIPLMALCSWSISRVGDSQTANHVPLWADLLLREDPNIQLSWIEDLRHSMIGNFKIPRFGSFVNAGIIDPDVKYVFAPMLRADVPIWIYWGTVSEPIGAYHPDLSKYRPTMPQIQAAMIPPRHTISNPPSIGLPKESSIIPPHPSILAAKSIHLPRGSRQMPDENWIAYFERMDAKREDKESKESFLQKQRRLAREGHSKTGEAPGKRGAVVFYWEKNDSGFRFRRQVARADVAELWEDYAPSQRRYNGFTDEWDICSEFDPDVTHLDDDEDDMADTQYAATDIGSPSDNIVTSAAAALALLPRRLNESIWNEVNPHYQPEVCPSAIDSATPHDTVVNIAHYRYGLILGSTYVGGSPSLPDWDTARRALGSNAGGSVHPDARNAIRELVGSFFEVAKGDIRHPHKTLWDLDPRGDQYLFKRSNVAISLCVEETSIGTVYWLESRNLHPSRNAPWRILVQDPATAIECLRRRWGPHLVDIAFELYSRGMAFKTCLAVDYCISLDRPAVIGLGYRLSGYTPSKQDYATCESIRNIFLTSPRARAALLKGGIIWRLARDVIPEAALLSGPSEEVYKTGQQIECNNGSYLDDDLTDDELNLISGVYKVFTGELPLHIVVFICLH